MSALANRSNPILDAMKAEVAKLIWQCFDDVKDMSIPLHISILKIPINISVKLSNLEQVITILVGPRPTA